MNAGPTCQKQLLSIIKKKSLPEQNTDSLMEPILLPTPPSPLSFNAVLLHYNVFCLITEPPETNFVFSSESGKSRMIMWRLSQAGSEADDTAIIWSLRCSIDSRGTHCSASPPLMESHDFSS